MMTAFLIICALLLVVAVLFVGVPLWRGTSRNNAVARDAAFADIVYTTITNSTTHTVALELDYATRYYWRVTALNTCGESVASSTFSFTTTPAPGECAAATTATSRAFFSLPVPG